MTVRHAAVLFVVLVVAARLAPVAQAQTPEQIQQCQNAYDEPELRVKACTALIESKAASEKDLSNVLVLRGMGFVDLGDADKAMADFTEALHVTPDSDFALHMRGQLLSDYGRFDAAIADFDQAIRLDPDEGSNFHGRAAAYEAKGLYERAIADFDEVFRLEPFDQYVLSFRCAARAHWGRQLDLALKDCGQALDRRNGDEFTLEQRGLIYLRLGRYREAIADYTGALKSYDGRVESLYGRGIAKLRTGDTAGGQADIAQATSIKADISKTFAAWGVTPEIKSEK